MNYDFQLNKNGDILFKQSNRDNSSLQLDFYVAESKGLMFNFYIDSYIDEQEYLNDLDPEFIFEFYIDTPKNNKEILCIENKEDYLYQQLKIRLSSALGTIKGNEEIGSTIDNYRHMLLNPDKQKPYTELIDCVRNAIKDILPNAEIDIYNKPSIYIDFTNSIIISIVQDDINYYYYL